MWAGKEKEIKTWVKKMGEEHGERRGKKGVEHQGGRKEAEHKEVGGTSGRDAMKREENGLKIRTWHNSYNRSVM